jgi:Asp-tRNA(Asn)/Glu-tRNA(Gln) amidotransferase A subunit family amidase
VTEPVPSALLLTASGQARLIAAGTLDATTLLRLQREAIARENPALNAYVQVLSSDEPAIGTSPLTGTTFAVKDNIAVRGVPSHGGLRALHAAPATQDATVVARLKSAGLECLGKLNMHAMALGATNHNEDFGNCYNPHRLTHMPGGSSGGSGAAVAAGLCGIALGTDTMGSVRVPASYCGVVGFKPSFEALPTDGVIPLSRVLDHVGILARGVEDVRHAYDLMRARSPHEPAPVLPAASACTLGIPADVQALNAQPEVQAAFERALDGLRSQGWTLQPVAIDAARFTPVRRAGLLLSEAELAHTMADVLAGRRGEVPADLVAMLDFAAGKSAIDLARAVAKIVETGQWFTRLLEPVDALLLPTTPQTAFAMDAPVPHDQADFTVLANTSGAPAISLPLQVAPDALPIGLQVVGHRGQDLALLHIAALLEAALAPPSRP